MAKKRKKLKTRKVYTLCEVTKILDDMGYNYKIWHPFSISCSEKNKS